jgi:hypothetical protein
MKNLIFLSVMGPIETFFPAGFILIPVSMFLLYVAVLTSYAKTLSRCLALVATVLTFISVWHIANTFDVKSVFYVVGLSLGSIGGILFLIGLIDWANNPKNPWTSEMTPFLIFILELMLIPIWIKIGNFVGDLLREFTPRVNSTNIGVFIGAIVLTIVMITVIYKAMNKKTEDSVWHIGYHILMVGLFFLLCLVQ